MATIAVIYQTCNWRNLDYAFGEISTHSRTEIVQRLSLWGLAKKLRGYCAHRHWHIIKYQCINSRIRSLVNKVIWSNHSTRGRRRGGSIEHTIQIDSHSLPQHPGFIFHCHLDYMVSTFDFKFDLHRCLRVCLWPCMHVICDASDNQHFTLQHVSVLLQWWWTYLAIRLPSFIHPWLNLGGTSVAAAWSHSSCFEQWTLSLCPEQALQCTLPRIHHETLFSLTLKWFQSRENEAQNQVRVNLKFTDSNSYFKLDFTIAHHQWLAKLEFAFLNCPRRSRYIVPATPGWNSKKLTMLGPVFCMSC